MKLQPLHVVAIILVVLSIVLAYDVITTSLNPYLTVSQVSGHPEYLQKEVQILANVENFSIDDQGAMQIILTDGNASIRVDYSGIPPQGMKANQKIVAIGVVTDPARMNASQLLVKCPSKYE
jgi:Cytochrome c-type biogenesis protein CcmE